jgi:integrase
MLPGKPWQPLAAGQLQVTNTGFLRGNNMPTLTALSLQTYKPQAKRREIRDHGSPGLYLIVQPKPTGAKSWALRFRNTQGKSAKLALGPVDLTADDNLSTDDKAPQVGDPLTLADARLLAGMLNRERARGVDLVSKYAAKSRRKSVADAKANSFKVLAVQFFIDHRTKRSRERPRRWRKDARVLGLIWPRDADPAKTTPTVLPRSLCDVWGNRPVSQISRRELEDVLRDARKYNIPGLKADNPEPSDNRARKLYAVLSVYFSWLARLHHVDTDPTAAIEGPSPPKARSRTLNAAEMRWVWLAAAQLRFPYGPIVCLLLLCGQRLVETSGMSWSELNDDASLWRIPGQRTKNHREHLLPLPILAREIINSAPRIENRDLVLSIGGTSAPSNWNKLKRVLDAAVSAIAKGESGKAVEIPHWTLHDLRRSFASGLQHIGIEPQVIERATNHISGTFGGVVGVYQRDMLVDDVRAALSSWSRYLQMVSDAKLHSAHEAFLLSGDDDVRSHNLRHFRECIRAGGERWRSYLDALTGKKPSKLADLTSERRRRTK